LKRGQALVVLLCLGFSAYFAYHALYGRHGLVARKEFLERASLLEFELESLEAVRAKLRRDVALLSPELPDTDLVEETARDVLGFVHPDDKVITKRQ
jgi:cell division protein FtsB